MADKFSFDPLADIKNYRQALRLMLEGGWVLPRDLMPSAMNAAVVPVDVLDNGTEIVVKAGLPGVKAEDVSISVQNTTLTIKATVHDEDDTRGAIYLRHERKVTAYIRTLTLPMAVKAELAEAHYKNGVLTLLLPKSESIRPRDVKVTSG